MYLCFELSRAAENWNFHCIGLNITKNLGVSSLLRAALSYGCTGVEMHYSTRCLMHISRLVWHAISFLICLITTQPSYFLPSFQYSSVSVPIYIISISRNLGTLALSMSARRTKFVFSTKVNCLQISIIWFASYFLSLYFSSFKVFRLRREDGNAVWRRYWYRCCLLADCEHGFWS